MLGAEPDRRIIYRGGKIDLALQSITLADGSRGEREVVVHRGAVALLPMVDPDHICLVWNDRYAVNERLLEVPAGTIDRGETPEQTAYRELAEETGYRTGRMLRLTDWWVSPGVLSERMYLFRAEDLTSGPTSLQPDERLETIVLPWADAVAAVWDGRIRDAKTILSLLWADRLRHGQ